jgi:hypothetical protein
MRDTCKGAGAGCVPATTDVSVGDAGQSGTGGGAGGSLSISGNGRFVAFASSSPNLVAGDTNNAFDVFVRDTCLGAPAGCAPNSARASVAADGTPVATGTNVLFGQHVISGDGRFVVFDSEFALVPTDTNGRRDVFIALTSF